MWLSLMWSVAHAGEIQVLTRTPVMVAIDGQVLEYPEGSTTVTAANLAGGTHQVEVKTMLGKLITATTLDVPVGQQVRIQYADKALTVMGSGPLPRQAPTVVVQPQVPAPAAAPAGMAAGPYQALLTQMQAAHFSTDRLELLKTAAANSRFSCAQVAALLGTFDFDNDRVEGAKLLAPRVVDRENAATISAVFQFSSNANTVQALFR